MLGPGEPLPNLLQPVQDEPGTTQQAFEHGHGCYGMRISCRVRQEGVALPQVTTLVADLAPGTYRLPPSDQVEVYAYQVETRNVPMVPVRVFGSLLDGEPPDPTPFTVTGGVMLGARSSMTLPRAPDYARELDAWAESRHQGGFAPLVQIRGFSGGFAPLFERDYVSGRFVPPGPAKLASYGVDSTADDESGNRARVYNLGTKPALVWMQYRLEV